MISVQFKGCGSGHCSWCRKEKAEVFAVVFDDGSFKGRMCLPCFRNAIRFKLVGAEDKPGTVPAAPADEAA